MHTRMLLRETANFKFKVQPRRAGEKNDRNVKKMGIEEAENENGWRGGEL